MDAADSAIHPDGVAPSAKADKDRQPGKPVGPAQPADVRKRPDEKR